MISDLEFKGCKLQIEVCRDLKKRKINIVAVSEKQEKLRKVKDLNGYR